ncbi:putative toxin-antitoxin system antitoxin component, TIGR02293 family [Algoriphagus locisalis]|uniref:Putative toxin-antitoxin system antitoxin component, TIGR02293 family n=1 Tax=Algoriphagus locisalis TaxID=305507 RepID=A0A1I7BVN7_9BACT|nr:antitoxin Xre-like helix-turn-helix domain-containing protein [Algoriphagus locisalis]SFT91227.1 putative toxin-antitoxin system antitoxin component, TIGR02293 family [Algoriphagus locisalis]
MTVVFDPKAFIMTQFTIFDPEVAYNTTDDKFINDVITLVRRGISFDDFEKFASKSAFTNEEWADYLHISERTMQRYQKEQKSFDSLQSEKIVEIALLQKRGVEVFGKKSKFQSWMETPCIALGGLLPKSFLDSSFGINLLKDELTRIEYGVLA